MLDEKMKSFQKLFEAFTNKGLELNLVGGCVRDIYIGREPKDWDFTTNALPEITKDILSNAPGIKSCWPIGEKFGTIAAILDTDEQVEITTYREDLTEGRHPEVRFCKTIKEDLSRRDFTMNSLGLNLDGTIIDPFKGQEDIKNNIIRTTGNPYERFSEDPLRMLRAVRFVSQLGFKIEPKTFNAIYNSAHFICSVSRERWLEEMNKLLLGDYASAGVEILKNIRLLNYILPEMMPLTFRTEGSLPSKNVWWHILTVIDKSPKILDVRWAALLHDIAKPQTRFEQGEEVHFFQHELLGAEMVEGITKRLKMGNEQRKSIVGLVALHQRVGDVVSRKYDPPVSVSGLRRIIRECEEHGCDIRNLVELFGADCSSKRPEIIERQTAHRALLIKALDEIKEEDLRPRLPSGIGNIIIEKFNLLPGPEVGVVKRKLDEMLLNGEISSKMTNEEIIEVYLKKENIS